MNLYEKIILTISTIKVFRDKMGICFGKLIVILHGLRDAAGRWYNVTATTEAFGPRLFGTPDFLPCSVKTNFYRKKVSL